VVFGEEWRKASAKQWSVFAAASVLMVVISWMPVVGEGLLRVPMAIVLAFNGAICAFRAGVGYAESHR
jgi:hypothetical protein